MIVEVRVIPNAKEFAIKREGQSLKMWIPEKAEKGRANAFLLSKLAELFHADVEIVRGKTARKKLVVVKGDEEEIRRIIQRL